jgi:hypothetical protein
MELEDCLLKYTLDEARLPLNTQIWSNGIVLHRCHVAFFDFVKLPRNGLRKRLLASIKLRYRELAGKLIEAIQDEKVSLSLSLSLSLTHTHPLVAQFFATKHSTRIMDSVFGKNSPQKKLMLIQVPISLLLFDKHISVHNKCSILAHL